MMLPVMPVIVMGALATPLAAHCHAASLAQLPGLGLHTGRDLRHVGNNVGTASLAWAFARSGRQNDTAVMTVNMHAKRIIRMIYSSD